MEYLMPGQLLKNNNPYLFLSIYILLTPLYLYLFLPHHLLSALYISLSVSPPSIYIPLWLPSYQLTSPTHTSPTHATRYNEMHGLHVPPRPPRCAQEDEQKLIVDRWRRERISSTISIISTDFPAEDSTSKVAGTGRIK